MKRRLSHYALLVRELDGGQTQACRQLGRRAIAGGIWRNLCIQVHERTCLIGTPALLDRAECDREADCYESIIVLAGLPGVTEEASDTASGGGDLAQGLGELRCLLGGSSRASLGLTSFLSLSLTKARGSWRALECVRGSSTGGVCSAGHDPHRRPANGRDAMQLL